MARLPCKLDVEGLLETMVLIDDDDSPDTPISGGIYTLKVQKYCGPKVAPELLGYTNISFATVSDALWMLKMHVDPSVDVDDESHPVCVFDKYNGKIYKLVQRQRRGHIPFPYKQA